MSTYHQQARGTDSAYERYLKSMDASMQQKVALTAAHLLAEGWLADMGMGSGTGSEALASLYPNMRVTGVDINPEMVKRAKNRYQLGNLDFRTGDIADECFQPGSLDMIFNSSVLHHVTSFNNYEVKEAARAVTNQVRQLKEGGTLIVRDFLRPDPETVVLELPDSTAELFERFSREFRSLLPQERRGFAYEELEPAPDGLRRFRLSSQTAVEFILRKDYVTDWETEVQEEYTYFTQEQFEALFHSLGLRILASTPLRNPWIVRNRFQGKFRLLSMDERLLMVPPTNYLIVGEKVSHKKGVRFLAGEERDPLNYLHFVHYRHRERGVIRDLVRRPNATLDVLPYYRQNGEVYVLARRSYPRPILSLCGRRLDGSLSPHYVTEPVIVLQKDRPLAQTVEEALRDDLQIRPENILSFTLGSHCFPSPGGLQERVQAVFVEIEPVLQSGTTQRVRAVSARQLLRAAQVDGLPDSRLEIHCAELLGHLGEHPGSWIGESLTLEGSSKKPPRSVGPGKPRRAFLETDVGSNFLHLGSRVFREVNASGSLIKETQLDYVMPRELSLNTVATALLYQHDGTTYIGLQDDDFPAVQCFVGHSNLLVAPAWRLPRTANDLLALESFTTDVLGEQHGLKVKQFFTLGGPYYPSAGATPEIVYPYAVEVEPANQTPPEPLIWIPIEEVAEGLSGYQDGHLRVLASRVFRAMH